MDKPETG